MTTTLQEITITGADEAEATKQALDLMIKNSSVVANCQQDDCGESITAAEITLGMADSQTCSFCVMERLVEEGVY